MYLLDYYMITRQRTICDFQINDTQWIYIHDCALFASVCAHSSPFTSLHRIPFSVHSFCALRALTVRLESAHRSLTAYVRMWNNSGTAYGYLHNIWTTCNYHPQRVNLYQRFWGSVFISVLDKKSYDK